MDDASVESDFTVTGTSPYTAQVNDIAIKQGELIRLVLRSELVVNQRDAESSVAATLMHQKRHSTKDPWSDADSFNLATLRAGQEVRLMLSAGETKKLYDGLTMQYALPVSGLTKGKERRLTVIDTDASRIFTGREKQLVEELLDREGEQVWDYLAQLRPNLFEAVAIKKQHQARQEALRQFEERMERGGWAEGEWEDFFRQNRWIFGYGLAYQFLSAVQDQSYYGGKNLTGRAGQRGDVLMATEAQARFTVLLDIKRPDTGLLGKQAPYRQRVHALSSELVGGVTQLQSNCHIWSTHGAQQPDNVRTLDRLNISTYGPRGILVIGQTAELDDDDKRSTFELFRRNLLNPEVLTYDELLARARYIVAAEPLEEETQR